MKSLLTIILISLSIFILSQSAFADDIELNTQQDLIFSFPGFYRFSDSANEQLKNLLKENKSVALVVSSVSGEKIRVAPAADNHEIGKKKTIAGPSTVALLFNKKNAKRYGLSMVPKGSVELVFEVQPFAGRPCSAPVSCQDDCGGNLGKCCEKDANGNQSKICVQVGLSSCGCGKR